MALFTYSRHLFPGQQEDEQILFLLYRHWFVLLGPLLAITIVGLIPLGVFGFFSDEIISRNMLDWFALATCVYYMFLWGALFYRITMFALDAWIVTDQRIVSRTQKGFFNQTVSELHFPRIQDISVRCEGLIPTMLNFGDLEIQTAGAENKFVFRQVPNPEEVKNKIMDLAKHHSQHGKLAV